MRGPFPRGRGPPRAEGPHGRVRVPLNLPNLLTLFRIALIPVLVLVFYLPYPWTNFAAALIFAVGAITDWADGYIARRYGMFSAFGAFLDPVADKLAVAVALVIIVQAHPTVFMALIAAVIIGVFGIIRLVQRDFVMGAILIVVALLVGPGGVSLFT